MDNNTDGAVDITGKPNAETMPVGAVVERKKNNALTIILGLLVVVFAGLAIYFGFNYYKTQDDYGKGDKSNTTTESDDVVEVSGDVGMADEYRSVESLMKEVIAGVQNSWGYLSNGSGLAYKPKGLNTYVPMKINIVTDIRYDSKQESDNNMALIKTKLEGLGFEALGIIPFLGSAGPQIYGYSNSNDVACGVYEESVYQNPNDINDGYEKVILECGKTNWGFLSDEELHLVGELEKAYLEKKGEYPRIINAYGAEAEKSQYEPYQVLRVGLGGGLGLFYRVSPNDEWQFFAITQAPLECSEYNTDDLRKAFAGDVCYNGMEASKVQP